MTELTIDYGEAYVAHWPDGCKCGAANWCAGWPAAGGPVMPPLEPVKT